MARHFGCGSDAGEIESQLGCGVTKGRQQTILRAEDPGTSWEVAIADAKGFFCDFYFESGEPVTRREQTFLACIFQKKYRAGAGNVAGRMRFFF